MEAMRECAAPTREPIHVGRLHFGIAQRMNAAVRQIVGDEKKKVGALLGSRLQALDCGAPNSRRFEKFTPPHGFRFY